MKFKDRVRVSKAPLLEGGFDLYDKKYKIHCVVARFDKEINIQFIQSLDPGKGNCQRFIKEFKKDLKQRGLKLVSSTPISETWKYICSKHNLKTYEKEAT